MNETMECLPEPIDYIAPWVEPVGEPVEVALHWEGYSVEILDLILDP